MKFEAPPIVEASISIDIKNNESWHEYYMQVVDSIRQNYPIVNERILFEVEGTIKKEGENTGHESEAKTIKDGFMLSNKEDKRYILLSPNTVKITKRKPYKDWNNIYDEFENILKTIKDLCSNKNMSYTNPSVIYHNEFFATIKHTDNLNELLNMNISFPDKLPDNLSKATIQLEMFENDETIGVEQILESRDDDVSIKINISVSDSYNEYTDINDISDKFKSLRKNKNNIFDVLTTHKAKETFV
ncbi:TIGR04255 family protein [Hymenobacter sp. BT186]|uniref:TIGR04255 family protein n=1 Tax=Hymenobacter telluris TaxID=2816474 RepID=A0A939EZE5_9BACT|nr:TIGR04255 family protein [Hymenobacter telluris]MBO0360288.1 TIGR04255 family protein [Hymenobacter telluris]MBW3376315.1 TIGR04255 family protein [Hymenobacter norwichensis]